MQINMKISYKLISTHWASKFPVRWYCHYWWGCVSILKVLKVESLHYFKKEVRDGVHFLHRHQSFYKLGLLFMMEVGRHVQSIQNRKLVIFFCSISKKSVTTAFFLLWYKTFRYFTRVQSFSLLLVNHCVVILFILFHQHLNIEMSSEFLI